MNVILQLPNIFIFGTTSDNENHLTRDLLTSLMNLLFYVLNLSMYLLLHLTLDKILTCLPELLICLQN